MNSDDFTENANYEPRRDENGKYKPPSPGSHPEDRNDEPFSLGDLWESLPLNLRTVLVSITIATILGSFAIEPSLRPVDLRSDRIQPQDLEALPKLPSERFFLPLTLQARHLASLIALPRINFSISGENVSMTDLQILSLRNVEVENIQINFSGISPNTLIPGFHFIPDSLLPNLKALNLFDRYSYYTDTSTSIQLKQGPGGVMGYEISLLDMNGGILARYDTVQAPVVSEIERAIAGYLDNNPFINFPTPNGSMALLMRADINSYIVYSADETAEVLMQGDFEDIMASIDGIPGARNHILFHEELNPIPWQLDMTDSTFIAKRLVLSLIDETATPINEMPMESYVSMNVTARLSKHKPELATILVQHMELIDENNGNTYKVSIPRDLNGELLFMGPIGFSITDKNSITTVLQ